MPDKALAFPLGPTSLLDGEELVGAEWHTAPSLYLDEPDLRTRCDGAGNG
jgi:hypothetical protein